MKKEVSVPSGDFDLEHDLFSKVISENEGIDTELPPWKSQSDFISEYISDIKKRIMEMVKSYINAEGSDHSWLNIDLIMQVLLFLFALAVLILMVFILSKIKSKSSRRDQKSTSSEPTFITNEDRLRLQVEAMMSLGKWNKAAAFRWRLHLERMKIERELTPLEYEMTQKASLPPAQEQYQYMFSSRENGKKWFEGYNKKLKILEAHQ